MAYKMFLIPLLILLTPTESMAVLRDPTQPPQALTPDSQNTENTGITLTLSAIWMTSASRRATINGITGRSGQTILDNIKILQIRKNSVTISQNGQIKILKLLNLPYKTPTRQ